MKAFGFGNKRIWISIRFHANDDIYVDRQPIASVRSSRVVAWDRRIARTDGVVRSSVGFQEISAGVKRRNCASFPSVASKNLCPAHKL